MSTEAAPPGVAIPRASRVTEAVWSGVYEVRPGDRVQVRDAGGEWHAVTAVTGVKRGHDFPILWVEGVGKNGRRYELPWPVEAIRAAVGVGE